jgi:hypothetical protein
VFALPTGAGLGGSSAPVADQATIQGLGTGDTITVVFWEDVAGQLAQATFTIAATAPGTITLSDPGHVINGGDSGGGAFYQGELIGNTWGFLVDQNREALGLVTVALLPEKIRGQ